jgi:L-ectoine synthase
MIVRTLDEVIGSPSHVTGGTWEGRRLLLSGDRMGFSLSDTIVKAGSEQRLHYKHHLEANYGISGRGEVVDVKTGRTFPIVPGTLYALEQHDEHILRAIDGDLRSSASSTHRSAGRRGTRPTAATRRRRTELG